MSEENKICYWCGNTNMTWYNTGEGGEGEFMTCDDHEWRGGELSIYAEEALKKYPVIIIQWNNNSL